MCVFNIRCRMVPILPRRTPPIVYLDFLGFKYKKKERFVVYQVCRQHP